MRIIPGNRWVFLPYTFPGQGFTHEGTSATNGNVMKGLLQPSRRIECALSAD